MVDFLKDSLFQQFLDLLESEFIITKADPKGRITYANDLFCKISGYTKEELIGKPHNIVRHPDMPKAVFKDLWDTIKIKKKPWKGFIKNKTKEGGFYWVIATIFPVFDSENPEEIIEYISLRKEITDIMLGYEMDQLYSKLYEILGFYMTSNDLKMILNFSLERILKLPFLEVLKKGGIMLWNEEKQELEMFVHKGVGESLLQMCNRVPNGRCLCGRAALRKEIIFKDCVDEDHENRPSGMQPHGHYNVPLIFNNELMGVLFLYVEHGYKSKEIEIRFLNLVGNILGSIIYKFQLQKKLEDLSSENFLILQHIKAYSSKDTFQYTKDFLLQSKQNGANHKNLVEYRDLNLMFLDVVNFTGLSENIQPEEVVKILNSFFVHIIECIYKNQGDIDKFIGDAIFAYSEDANKFLETALEILDLVEIKEKNPYQLQIRIGIHSGMVIQTNIGNDFRKDFTLIGDVVNTTQRIERVCKPNTILASEAFLKRIDPKLLENMKVSKRLMLKAKHKSNPVYVYSISKIKVAQF